MASDNGKSNQLQSCKTLPAGVTDRISKTGTPVPKLKTFKYCDSETPLPPDWEPQKDISKRKCNHLLYLKGLYHSQEGCTTAARNSSDDFAMQGMWCFTPRAPNFDLQEHIFLSMVFRIWLCWVVFPLIPQNYPVHYVKVSSLTFHTFSISFPKISTFLNSNSPSPSLEKSAFFPRHPAMQNWKSDEMEKGSLAQKNCKVFCWKKDIP